MKPQGRPYVPLTESEKKIVMEYLNNNETCETVAKRYGMTKATLQNKVRKYRKEKEKNAAKIVGR